MDVEDIRRLAGQAAELKDDPAFKAAVLALRQEWHALQMMTNDREAIFALAMKMQALEEIPKRLQVFINDYVMVRKRNG